ncbi:cell division protein FtsQ/DivIB [Hominifimenecus sp. rT4P-3]|uniref:cell division protein FtsQ/DivIB n=1 Tax=Hominifimenecus sp. rT4P-3 TaxID=3242979 RepID=UPI003DA3EAE0
MKKALTKNRKIGIAVFLTGVVLITALLSVRVQQISITGNEYYSQDELESLLFPGRMDRSPLVIWVRQKLGKKPAIPFVEKYTVNLTGLTSAEVLLYEKSMIGYVEFMGSYLYFDKDGMIVESASERYGTLPKVTGLDFDYAVLHQTLPVKEPGVFAEILQISQYLEGKEIVWGEETVPLGELLDQIGFSSDGEIICGFGEIKVKLGGKEFLEGKLREMKDILPQLYGRAGTLYLDTYDENEADPSYIFK